MSGTSRPLARSSGRASAVSYDGYEAWKGWDRLEALFSFSPDDADYYAGECREARIENADVLEIGFGSGGFLAWAQAKGARVAGTEINTKLCEAARERGIPLLPPEIETVASEYGERFDTIAAFDVFEHFELEEIATRLRAFEALLRPQGHVILRFPNGQSPFGLAPQNADPTHKTALSLAKLEPLILRLSFEVVRYGPAYRTPGRGLVVRVVRKIRYLLRDRLAGILNLVYAQAIPWDPVVTLVLRKSNKSETNTDERADAVDE